MYRVPNQQELQARNNQSDLETTKTIEQIRKDGLDKQTLERIAEERAEMERAKQEARERLPGHFISFKQDKEQKNLLFTGAYQKIPVPAKDFYRTKNTRWDDYKMEISSI